MAPTPSIRIVKHSDYKGGTQSWSNRHHFSGGTPADLTHWTTLVNNIVAAEKLACYNASHYDEAICYAAGSDLPLHTITLSGTGSLSSSGAQSCPLEVSALLRWSTDQRTSKNHPIYLFAYMRATLAPNTGDPSVIFGSLKTALETYGQAWVDGFSDGTNTYHRAGPNGAVAQDKHVAPYLTHRDFRD